MGFMLQLPFKTLRLGPGIKQVLHSSYYMEKGILDINFFPFYILSFLLLFPVYQLILTQLIKPFLNEI